MLKSISLILAIVVVINGRPQMWKKNYGMREEVDVAPSFQDENEMPIYVDKRLNQRNPFELANAKEDSSSEEDLSKYASLKDAGSNNEDSSEEPKDTMQQFYLPLGVVVENPQGEILAKKEQIADNSNSEESSSNEIQRQYSNDDETPIKFYNPPGVIIDRIVYRSMDEVLPSEQILEMPRQQVPKLSRFEESNEGNNNDYANVYFPQGLVIDPYQKLDVSSEEQQVENVFVKEFVELERPMRDYDIQEEEVEEPRVVVPEMDGQEFPELEIPDVPEVPEIPGAPEVPEFPEVPEVPYADAEEEMTNFE